MTLEPCRAMVGGRFCGGRAYSDGTLVVCRANDLHDVHLVESWNQMQLDRLDAARWREACGRGLVSKVDAEAIDRALGEIK